MTGSYACALVTPITVWVNLETCQITVVCLVKHFTCHSVGQFGDVSDYCSLFSKTFYMSSI